MSDFPRVAWTNGKERVVLIDNVTFECERLSTYHRDLMGESVPRWESVDSEITHLIAAHAFDALTDVSPSVKEFER